MWAKIAAKILEILEKLPGLLGAFGLGYKVGSAETDKVKKELTDTRVKLMEAEIDLKVEREFDGKSADDVIDDALARARRKIQNPGSEE